MYFSASRANYPGRTQEGMERMGKREFVLGALCLLAVALLSGSVREAPETAQADAPAQLPAEIGRASCRERV